jgi:hypothetical protein
VIIAIDFDGTIVKNEWPEIGRFRFLAKPVINWLQKRGHELILFTCRERELLLKAVDFLKRNNIEFKYHNENTKELIMKYGGDCRKISADLYLDDKALFPGWWIVPLVVLWIEWREKRAKRRGKT